MRLATIDDALAELALGRPVLVADDADRENEVDLVMSAAVADESWMGWAVRHGSGVICAPLPGEVADLLGLPPMVRDNQDPKGTAYTVSIDAARGVSTGISAADRTATVRALADPSATTSDLTRPGHVFPLRARPGGVLERPGHTEAAVDLCRLAGLAPVGVIVELVHDDGSMMRLDTALELAERDGLLTITIADLVAWRRRRDRVRAVARTTLPTPHGTFAVTAYVDRLTGAEHLALVSPAGRGDGLVRVHSECLTGDVFGSRRCDCGPQLEASLERIARDGGTVVYLRGHEGRGVGLADKLRAYELQDAGYDTVDAQTQLGLPVDAREYDAAAAILQDLEIAGVRLLTNNPRKAEALQELGIDVTEMVPLHAGQTMENERYLRTKRERLGHTPPLESVPSVHATDLATGHGVSA
ncbi:GTP cyclohydrolase II [Allobranchiibius sp. CTAmp26]|uniref:GTP cyclohydrolase II n=1 Tax=Allobranchiibius sp. CTAmp26 TaxID=2815214 RepID=UPI001FB595D7|nr:GTP cyclohydrolase II [Allobranchiibius sp. CTAmp26]